MHIRNINNVTLPVLVLMELQRQQRGVIAQSRPQANISEEASRTRLRTLKCFKSGERKITKKREGSASLGHGKNEGHLESLWAAMTGYHRLGGL